MATMLGTPYERGKSDEIISRRPKNNAKVDEGLFVADAGNGEFEAMAANRPILGVMGAQEIVGGAVVVNGRKVYCQTDDTAAPTLGAPVYVVVATGKVTAIAGSNTQINATFTEAALKTDGRADNTSWPAAPKTGLSCLQITFHGGV